MLNHMTNEGIVNVHVPRAFAFALLTCLLTVPDSLGETPTLAATAVALNVFLIWPLCNLKSFETASHSSHETN